MKVLNIHLLRMPYQAAKSLNPEVRKQFTTIKPFRIKEVW
jgi:hypothetical protein